MIEHCLAALWERRWNDRMQAVRRRRMLRGGVEALLEQMLQAKRRDARYKRAYVWCARGLGRRVWKFWRQRWMTARKLERVNEVVVKMVGLMRVRRAFRRWEAFGPRSASVPDIAHPDELMSRQHAAMETLRRRIAERLRTLMTARPARSPQMRVDQQLPLAVLISRHFRTF